MEKLSALVLWHCFPRTELRKDFPVRRIGNTHLNVHKKLIQIKLLPVAMTTVQAAVSLEDSVAPTMDQVKGTTVHAQQTTKT